MIEIITGNNRGACLEYVSSRSSDLIKEGRTLSRFSSIDETNDEIILNELLGQDLFTTKKVYILSDILLAPRVIEVLETQCDKFNDKYILWHEDAIPAQIIKNMEKIGTTIHLYKKKEEKDSAIFALTDAYARRDIKQSWIIYNQFIEDGMSSHQMIGPLWWQAKMLLLVEKSQNMNPGLSPYVYTKTKKLLPLYKKGEILKKALNLLSVYHNGHLGDDIEILLEKHLLEK